MSDATMGKDNWVALFHEIGLDEASMTRWHQLFEQRHPQQHQAFLQWLGLSDEQITKVRGL